MTDFSLDEKKEIRERGERRENKSK